MLVGEEIEYRGEIEQPVEFVKAEKVEPDTYKISSIPASSQLRGYNLGDTVKAIFDPMAEHVVFQSMIEKSDDKLLRTYDPIEPNFIKQLKNSGCTIQNSEPATIHTPAKAYRDVQVFFNTQGYEYEVIA